MSAMVHGDHAAASPSVPTGVGGTLNTLRSQLSSFMVARTASAHSVDGAVSSVPRPPAWYAAAPRSCSGRASSAAAVSAWRNARRVAGRTCRACHGGGCNRPERASGRLTVPTPPADLAAGAGGPAASSGLPPAPVPGATCCLQRPTVAGHTMAPVLSRPLSPVRCFSPRSTQSVRPRYAAASRGLSAAASSVSPRQVVRVVRGVVVVVVVASMTCLMTTVHGAASCRCGAGWPLSGLRPRRAGSPATLGGCGRARGAPAQAPLAAAAVRACVRACVAAADAPHVPLSCSSAVSPAVPDRRACLRPCSPTPAQRMPLVGSPCRSHVGRTHVACVGRMEVACRSHIKKATGISAYSSHARAYDAAPRQRRRRRRLRRAARTRQAPEGARGRGGGAAARPR